MSRYVFLQSDSYPILAGSGLSGIEQTPCRWTPLSPSRVYVQSRLPPFVMAYILLRRRVAPETRRRSRYRCRSTEKMPGERPAREELFVLIVLLSGRNMQGHVWLGSYSSLQWFSSRRSSEEHWQQVQCCVVRVDGSNPQAYWIIMAKVKVENSLY